MKDYIFGAMSIVLLLTIGALAKTAFDNERLKAEITNIHKYLDSERTTVCPKVLPNARPMI